MRVQQGSCLYTELYSVVVHGYDGGEAEDGVIIGGFGRFRGLSSLPMDLHTNDDGEPILQLECSVSRNS